MCQGGFPLAIKRFAGDCRLALHCAGAMVARRRIQLGRSIPFLITDERTPHPPDL
jgi:hypothetical protein